MNRKYFLFPAILELEIPMGFSDTLKPICLSHWTKKQYNRNDRGVIAGWGQHRQGQSWASKLKEVQAVIFTNPFCREILKYHYNYHWHKLTRYGISLWSDLQHIIHLSFFTDPTCVLEQGTMTPAVNTKRESLSLRGSSVLRMNQ